MHVGTSLRTLEQLGAWEAVHHVNLPRVHACPRSSRGGVFVSVMVPEEQWRKHDDDLIRLAMTYSGPRSDTVTTHLRRFGHPPELVGLRLIVVSASPTTPDGVVEEFVRALEPVSGSHLAKAYASVGAEC